MTQFQSMPRRWLPLVPAALALLLQWTVIIGRGFDGLYGQDAFAYYTYSLQLRDSLLHGRMPPPFFWPVGYPALVALSSTLVGLTPLAAQLVSSLAGAGVVLLVYALAYDLQMSEDSSPGTARWVALVAGLLATSCGQLWQWSITTMSDTPALFWATLSGWALVRYGRGGALRWLILAGVAFAAALMTRWIYGLLVVPFGIYWLMQANVNRPRFVHLFVALLAGLAVLSPQIVLSAGNPAPVLRHHSLTGWSPLNALRRTLVTVDGIEVYPLPVAVFYAKAAASPRYLFPLFTPFLLMGIGVSVRRRRWRTVILLAGWGAVVFVYLSGIPFQNFRYALTLLPAEVILTAIGLRHFVAWLRPRWRPFALGYVLVGLVGGIWYSAGVLREFVDRKDADLAVARWVEQAVPRGQPVIAFGITLTLMHYTDLQVHELFLIEDAALRDLAGQDRPLYMVVPVDSLETQWRGYPLERRFRWLRDGPGLEELGRQGGYTLFRVGTERNTGKSRSAVVLSRRAEPTPSTDTTRIYGWMRTCIRVSLDGPAHLSPRVEACNLGGWSG